MTETVSYAENQYKDDQLLLIGQCTYEMKFDTLNSRYFVMNQNDELIYLDQIESVAFVQLNQNQTLITSFFYSEKKSQVFLDAKKDHHHFFFDILYIVSMLSVIVFLSVFFYLSVI